MKIRLLASAVLSVAVLAGCSNAEQAQAPTTEPTKAGSSVAPAQQQYAETYVVDAQGSYPPFSILDEKGNITGMDIDILKAIGEKQKIGFSFVSQGSQTVTSLLNALNEDKADILATGINITEERMQRNDFTNPYIHASWVALVDKSKQVTNFEDLANQPIAVQGESLSETQLAQTKITNQPVPVKTVYLGIKEVKQNKAVAVYDVDTVLATYAKENDLQMVADKRSGQIPIGFALKKGNTALKEKLDKGLEEIKKDGTYDKIVAKWINQEMVEAQRNNASASASATK